MQDIISIIIPIYKVPINFLRKNIESCINQDYKELEIILVDDGSPDECGRICDEYKIKDKRIKVIHQNNKGLSGARNSGYKLSTGKWIMFVDGDDYLEENCCSTIIEFITDEIDVLCFNSYRDSINKKRVIGSKLIDNNIYRNEKEKLQYLTLDFNAHISTSWGKIIKKSLIDNNKLYHNETLKQGAEGIEFCMRLFSIANVVKYINIPLYNYIYNENSISAMPSEKNNYLVLECFKTIRNNIKNNEILLEKFYERMQYVVVTTTISSYFNPKNKNNYSYKKAKLKQYLKEDIIVSTMKRISPNIDLKRRIILLLIKFHFYYVLFLLARIYRK